VALASAGPYAGLHLAPDKHANTLPVFFTTPDAFSATKPTASKH